MRSAVAASLVALCPAGCASTPPGHPASPAPAHAAIELTARLDTPTDVTLRWTDHDPRAAGHTVEYANAEAGQYVPLAFLPPGRHTFTHPDLIPRTRFYYRVRPFYGPASRPVDVTLPTGPAGPAVAKAQRRDGYRWAEPKAAHDGAVARYPIRNGGAAGAPTGLRGTVVHANAVKFTWRDHAAGEEGYLLEKRPAGASAYSVVALLDPDITSFGLVRLGHEKPASYRVRAFYHGEPSNLAYERTGGGP
jgi:hypothetical protein